MKWPFVFQSLLLVFWIRLANAQDELRPRIGFFADCVRVGQPVRLFLSVDYETHRRILLPDTNHNFSPFELQKKDYFPTRTRNGISRDCVLYTLATFELDTVQRLRLPVYEFSSADSLVHSSNEVSVRLLPVLPVNKAQQPDFQSENQYQVVPRSINYPYILLGFGVVVLLLAGLNLFFNRPIQRFIYIIVENRRQKAFMKQFDRLTAQMERNLSTSAMEQLLVLWKKYIQRVDGKPFTTFTSTEISQVLPDANLKLALSEIDRWIYGGIEMSDWRKHIGSVKEISVLMFLQKKEAIRSGKFE